MPKRKGISPSMRWTVLSRDGFACRYCGAQAGQESVSLHVDHVVPVVSGGDNSLGNLVTACQKCNGGKATKCLDVAPTSRVVIERMNEQAKLLQQQAQAIQATISARGEVKQQVTNMKCTAYGIESCSIATGESSLVSGLCREFGPDVVLKWYESAERNRVPQWRAIQYVCGIARKVREEAAHA